MAYLKTNEIDLYYEIHGSGTPLVLLSGLATDSQSWLGCINSLSEKHKVIILDNRGCGRTSPQETDTTISLMAKDVISLLKHLQIKKVNILGNSMGGFIALELAINYPNYVNKLILEASACKNTESNNLLFDDWSKNLEDNCNMHEWFREVFKWLFHPKIFNNSKNLEAKLTYASKYPYKQSAQAFKNQLNAVKNYDNSKKLNKILSQTLILCGKEDLLFPVDYIRSNLNHILNSKTVIIENAAHAIHVDAPFEFIKHVNEFI